MRAAAAAVYAALALALGIALLAADGGRENGVLTAGFAAVLLLAPPVAAAVVTGKVVTAPIKALSVELFVIVVATAFFGTDKPIENLAPTFVWIAWWVGLGYAVALLGNLWALINPWKIVYEWAENLFGLDDGPDAGSQRYPADWELWPAAILFLAFAWLENVYSGASIPLNLGLLVLAYSIVTWGGMALFGKHRWLARGEAFTVLFGLFSRFSPSETRVPHDAFCGDCPQGCAPTDDGCIDCHRCFERAVASGEGELNLRPYAVGLASPVRLTTAAGAFVIIALASVTFDGLTATEIWTTVVTESYGAVTGVFGASALAVINTAGLVLMPLLFLVVYLLVISAVRRLSRDPGTDLEVAKTFVLALVPIALAYNLAHFISLLAIQGQNLVPLASDPFGVGWDLFGTLGYRIDTGRHRTAARMVRLCRGDRPGPRRLRVRRARHRRPRNGGQGARPEGPVPDAGAHGLLHRYQPLDNRPAHRLRGLAPGPALCGVRPAEALRVDHLLQRLAPPPRPRARRPSGTRTAAP